MTVGMSRALQWDNAAEVENQGFELSLNWNATRATSFWVNYSWQDEPIADGVGMRQRIDDVRAERKAKEDLDGDGVIGDTSSWVNIPAEHRLSIGGGIDDGIWFGSLTVDYVDETFWQDVLDDRFWGWVPSYSLVSVKTGRRWPAKRLQLTGQITNLLDDQIQQHILGDIIGLRAAVTLTYAWGPAAAPR